MLATTDVRFYIEDRSPDDNPMAGDLMFTDEEIALAMVRAGRAFNSVQPPTLCVDPDNLPDNDELFLAATTEFLYRARLHSLMRNRFEYKGGGIETSVDEPKIKGFQAMIEQEAAAWRTLAVERKVRANLSRFYGQLG